MERLFWHEQGLILATLTLVIKEDIIYQIFSWRLLFRKRLNLIIVSLLELFLILFSWLWWHEKPLSFWRSHSLPLLWLHALMLTYILNFFRSSWVILICPVHVSLVVVLSIWIRLFGISKVLFRRILSNRILLHWILFRRTDRILFFGRVNRILFNFGRCILSKGMLLCSSTWSKISDWSNILTKAIVSYVCQGFIVWPLFLFI